MGCEVSVQTVRWNREMKAKDTHNCCTMIKHIARARQWVSICQRDHPSALQYPNSSPFSISISTYLNRSSSHTSPSVSSMISRFRSLSDRSIVDLIGYIRKYLGATKVGLHTIAVLLGFLLRLVGVGRNVSQRKE